MPVPEADQRIAAFHVSCLPEDDPHAHVFTLRVEHQRNDWWAVLDGSQYLNLDGGWDLDTHPGDRRDEWTSRHWFTLPHALKLAKGAAAVMTAGDLTLGALLAKREARDG